jgi:hypothetical protein
MRTLDDEYRDRPTDADSEPEHEFEPDRSGFARRIIDGLRRRSSAGR